MLNNICDSLIKVDNFCDRSPFLSTVTNVVGLFMKSVFLFNKSPIKEKNHFYTHIKEKSFLRCVVLLIPVLGNLIIFVYDKRNKNLKSISSRIADQQSTSKITQEEELEKVFEDYYSQNADQGLAEAQCCFATILYKKRGRSEGELNLALKYFQKAADQGLAEAQCWFATVLYEKEGRTEEERKLALEYSQKAADQGLAEAQCWFATVLYEKEGRTEEERKLALEYFQKAADQGLAHILFNISVTLTNHKGVTRNELDIAEQYYQKSRNLGF